MSTHDPPDPDCANDDRSQRSRQCGYAGDRHSGHRGDRVQRPLQQGDALTQGAERRQQQHHRTHRQAHPACRGEHVQPPHPGNQQCRPGDPGGKTCQRQRRTLRRR